MRTNYEPVLAMLSRWKLALVFFAAGSLITGCLTHLNQTRADSDRVFQLLVYHAVSGKVTALESRFRDAAKLIDEHGLLVIGYWIPNDKPAWDNTFIYIVAHPSREEARKNWQALHADPAFQKCVKSEEAEKLIEKVDSTYMRPTDFSPTR